MKLSHLLCFFFVMLCQQVWAAKTYITVDNVEAFESPNGKLAETWPSRTIFTSSDEDSEWIRVSGHFPEGVWQPLKPNLYVANSEFVKERASESKNAPKAVIYETLKSKPSRAKAYRLREPARVFSSREAAENYWQVKQIQLKPNESYTQPSLMDSNLETIDYEASKDELLNDYDSWDKGYTFTSNFETNMVIKATGFFPGGKWKKLPEQKWLTRPVRLQNRTKPAPFLRKEGTKRFAVIDKKKFEVAVYEVTNGEQTKLMKAPVALGYDRCLSAEKGGKCYYTPEGQYTIEFKLFDADGINWCIPKKMEAEFKEKIARGERCWRGIMGNHAMHFGNSLFLHGTSNPKSIGSRSTHGCVRLRNNDIEIVFRLLQNGDSVLISETPEEFDLIALAKENNEAVKERTTTESKIGSKSAVVTLVEEGD